MSSDSYKGLGFLANLLKECESAEDVQAVLMVVLKLAAELKPIFQGFSRFVVELDIAAIKQYEEAGISREDAVILRTSTKTAVIKSLQAKKA